MKVYSFLIKSLIILLIPVLFSCSKQSEKNAYKGPEILNISEENGFYGWNAVTLRNAFTRLDVVPDLGGKIMGYQSAGYQVLWHNTLHEGTTDIFQTNDIGGEFINTGGAKVWPAPQDEWGGPPDRVIDGLPYEYEFDGSRITVTSPEDTGEGRTGLQYRHTYSLVPSSSIVELNLSMKNVSDRPVEWALWHLVTIPGKTDATVYVPVNEGDWQVMYGAENPALWQGVDNGLFRARYQKTVGKAGMKTSEGWAAWHDEENNIAFVMTYTLDSRAQYPHNGHTFEIWSNGANESRGETFDPNMAYMELEVLGPLAKLSPGDSSTMKLNWALCHCSAVKEIIPGAVVVEPVTRNKNNVVTGTYGVFYSGVLEEYFVDKDGNKKGRTPIGDVSPLTEVTFRREPIIPLDAVALRYQVRSYEHEILCVLGEVSLK